MRSCQMFSLLIAEALGRISGVTGNDTLNVRSDTLGRESHGSPQRKVVNFNSQQQLISGNLHIFQSLSRNDFNFVNFKADAVVISITNYNNHHKKKVLIPLFYSSR